VSISLYGAWHGVGEIPYHRVRWIDVIDPIWDLMHDPVKANGSTI
jgi:hypothetical protein